MHCNQHKHNCKVVKVHGASIDSVRFMKPPQLKKKYRQFVWKQKVEKLPKWKLLLERWLRRTVYTAMASALVYVSFLAVTQKGEPIIYESHAEIIDRTPAKIAELKQQTIERLAEECETKGAEEPDSVIILDSNSRMSLGRYQWQITSVQHYVKTLYGKEITRKQAILIALDEGEIDLDELTTKVMFDVTGGWKEWLLCSERLGLATEVRIINSL